MKYLAMAVALGFLLMGCNRDAKVAQKLPGVWKHEGASSGGGNSFASTMTISADGTFSYFRRWNQSGITNSFSGTWQVSEGFMLLTLTNRSGPHPLPTNFTPVIKSRIVRVNEHEFVSEADGITTLSSR